jgi:hypothetical protein
MKIYTVHMKAEGDKSLESTVFVPEAFSWPAIIFPLNIIGSIISRNWAFLMVLVIYLFTAVVQFHDHQVDGAISGIKLAILPFLGIWANDFLRLTLKHRGYQMVSVVSGENESEAQLRFFEEMAPNSPAAPA